MTKALVVEDTPLNMELVLEILKSLGMDVDIANDGEEAVKKTEKEAYDIIFMDIALPGIDGAQATSIIKNRPGYKNVPVIALTAFAMKGDKEKFMEGGFDDYIAKPIDVTNFIKKVENLIGEK